jgi:hypothetical protein
MHKSLSSPSPTMLKSMVFGCFLDLSKHRFFECRKCLTLLLGHFGWPYLETYVFRRKTQYGIGLSMQVIKLGK